MSLIKKIFFFSLFVFILSLLFWGVYIISFKKNIPLQEEITRIKNAVPEIIEENIKQTTLSTIAPLSQEEVFAPILSQDGKNILYLSKNSHQLMKTDLDGENKINLSNKSFPGSIGLFWSLDKSKIIIKTKNENNVYTNYFYDIKNDFLQELNNNIFGFSWQTNADRIFYEYFNKEKKIRTLNISDPSGENWTKLIELSYSKPSFFQIPKTGILSFWNSGDAYYQTKLQTIPIVGGETKTLFENSFGADYLWNHSGNQLLVSQSNTKGGNKMQLAVMNQNGGEYKNLDIPTFISKCVWSKNGETVFYALPGEIPENSILPNDYKESKFNSADTFWKVNTKTGEKKRLIDTSEINARYDATQLFLSQDESILFFVNKIDSKLYRITL